MNLLNKYIKLSEICVFKVIGQDEFDYLILDVSTNKSFNYPKNMIDKDWYVCDDMNSEDAEWKKITK